LNLNLNKLVEEIMTFGPRRVMVNGDEAMSPYRARENHAIEAEVIFIRNDGFSLGAPSYLEMSAWLMWKDEWVAFLRKPEKEAKPISEYNFYGDSK